MKQLNENGNNGNISDMERCPGCGRHCPADALSCGRGRAIMAREEPSGAEHSRHGRPEDGEHGRHGRPEDGEHSRHGRPDDREHGRHGRPDNREHGRHGRPEDGEHGRHGRPEDGEHGWHGRPDDREHGRHGRPDGIDFGCREPHDGFPFEKDESLYGLMRRCGHHLYQRRGSQGQRRVLAILQERGSMQQRELQEFLGIQPGSMSELIGKLEQKGLLIRSSSEEDRRSRILTLTERGREMAGSESEEQELFNTLSDEEQQQLKALLSKLLEAWNSN